MSKEVKDYILRCDICQRVQISRHCLYSKLLVLPIPQGPILELIIDFIIGLPPAKIRTEKVADAILIIINRYIKFSGYFIVIIIITTAELADLFLK
jgi:intergrase/recombinase